MPAGGPASKDGPPGSAERQANERARHRALQAYAILDTPQEQAYDDIVLLARMVCHAPVSTITFIDRDRQWFKARAGLAEQQTPLSQALCAVTIETLDTPYVVRDIDAEPGLSMRPVDAQGVPLRFYAGVPLRSPEGHALGVLCVLDHAPRELAPAQQAGLEALGRQTQHLLELRRMAHQQRQLLQQRMEVTQRLRSEKAELQRRHDDLQREASRDPLTGLYHRGVLRRLRERPEAMARLQAGVYALAVVDIDHFKRVNDRYGHLLGDQALRAVAQAVVGCVRENDVAVRYGGEEFLVVLPATPLAAAFEVAERIREAVMRIAMPFPLTVSIGVAAGDPALDVPERVFERADQALYRAKSGGRNRVVADEQDWRGA